MSRDVTRTQMGAPGMERLKTRTYTLEILEGPDVGKRLTTGERVTRLGTHPDCDLELNDPLTSRLHARIEIDPLGHRLIDDSSKNGTFIDGMRIRDLYLTPEIRIRLGGNVIRYTPGDQEVEIALSRDHRFGGLLGRSAAMREIFAVLSRVAPTDMTVLIEGESGTGKELVAQALHDHSDRAGGPLVVFDCSAVSPSLIESELFGHVKGAFTGATGSRTGAFEQADGGTLFLDEIGELPLDMQPKLLRALEQREVRPVGGNRPVRFNARIVAATNRNLQKEAQASQFREDLYFRLAVVRLILPPLRRRAEDIPLLVRHFLDEFNTRGDTQVQVGYDTIIKLQKHGWPGNVRELRNFVERATMLATGDRLETRYLAPPAQGEAPAPQASAEPTWAQLDDDLPFKDAKARLVEDFERAYWARLLEKTDGNISAAARIAGVHRKSAEYLLKKLDLKGQG